MSTHAFQLSPDEMRIPSPPGASSMRAVCRRQAPTSTEKRGEVMRGGSVFRVGRSFVARSNRPPRLRRTLHTRLSSSAPPVTEEAHNRSGLQEHARYACCRANRHLGKKRCFEPSSACMALGRDWVTRHGIATRSAGRLPWHLRRLMAGPKHTPERDGVTRRNVTVTEKKSASPALRPNSNDGMMGTSAQRIACPHYACGRQM